VDRAERERLAYDEGDVDEINERWHGRFPHVFSCPNTMRHERYLEDVLRSAVQGGSAVDVGCGRGRFSERLLSWGASYVLGVDVSETSIAEAKQREIPGRLEFAVADASKLDGSYDVVCGRSVLHHIDYRTFLQDVYRDILAPGGTLAFMEPLGGNPLIQAYWRLASGAHTDDERAFTEDDLDWLRSSFPSAELRPFNLLSFPAALVTSQLTDDPDNVLLRACDAVDWSVAHRPRAPLSWFRQTLVILRKPGNGR
jgi:SAM-dependent methyltransferase